MDRHAQFFQHLQHADVGEAARAAAGQGKPDARCGRLCQRTGDDGKQCHEDGNLEAASFHRISRQRKENGSKLEAISCHREGGTRSAAGPLCSSGPGGARVLPALFGDRLPGLVGIEPGDLARDGRGIRSQVLLVEDAA